MTDPQPTQRPAAPLRLRVRRTPNYVAFILVGAVVGVIVGAAVDLLGPAAPTYNNASSVAFLGAIGALLGAIVGGVIAAVVETALRRAGR